MNKEPRVTDTRPSLLYLLLFLFCLLPLGKERVNVLGCDTDSKAVVLWVGVAMSVVEGEVAELMETLSVQERAGGFPLRVTAALVSLTKSNQ